MIDLLPKKEKKTIAHIRFLRKCDAVLGLCMIAGIAALLLLLPTAYAVRAQYDVATETLSAYATKGSLIASESIDALTHRLVPLTQAFAQPLPPSPVDLMFRIQNNIPANIVITQYAVNDIKTPSLVLSGRATTRAALQQFVELLGKTPGAVRVDSPVDNYVKNSNPDFTITVVFSK